ncbi:hypothetical protein BV911_17980 [Pseudoruegeria sp. SK021]|nr:hypothetical protein BV911_17980 [Pseudoruegeria sp. SK021]
MRVPVEKLMKPFHLADAVCVHSAHKQNARSAETTTRTSPPVSYRLAHTAKMTLALGGCHND